MPRSEAILIISGREAFSKAGVSPARFYWREDGAGEEFPGARRCPQVLQAFVSCHGLWEAAIIEQCDSMPDRFAHLSEASRDVAHGAFHGTMGDRVILPWDDQF